VIVRGNALQIPLADESCDLIVSSPPYWSLRAYQDNGESLEGQLGSEETPQAFIDNLMLVMAECWRVLKPSGSCFINLGDKFSNSGGHNNATLGVPHVGASPKSTLNNGGGRKMKALAEAERVGLQQATRRNAPDRYNQNSGGIRAKSLMGLPWRFAIACIDAGWILRSEIIFSKLNGLPESVVDRVRRSHEQIFHLTKQGKYFASVDEIRTKKSGSITKWNGDSVSCQRCGLPRAMDVGNGSPERPPKGTESSGSTGVQSLLTGSHMNSGSDQSPLDFKSTIYAETEDASGISKPSQSEKISCEETLSPLPTHAKPIAAMGTHSTKPIPTEFQTAAECAVCACEQATGGFIGETSLGSLPGSVWQIPSEPLIVPDWATEKYNLPSHFAAFCQEIPRRIILGWSPNGICTVCGEGRRPVVDKSYLSIGDKFKGGTETEGRHNSGKRMGDGIEATITGYACACPDDQALTRPAVILDPFGGTGTTALVAEALGRKAISLDLSADYSRLAKWRVESSGHGKKAEQRTWRERQGALI